MLFREIPVPRLVFFGTLSPQHAWPPIRPEQPLQFEQVDKERGYLHLPSAKNSACRDKHEDKITSCCFLWVQGDTFDLRLETSQCVPPCWKVLTFGNNILNLATMNISLTSNPANKWTEHTHQRCYVTRCQSCDLCFCHTPEAYGFIATAVQD